MFLTPSDTVARYQESGSWSGENVDALVRRAVAAGTAQHGSCAALIDPPNRASLDGRAPERLSWAELDERIDGIATALLAHGLGKDDVIVAQLPNTVDAVVLLLAAARIGAILSPVVMQYRAHELAYIVRQTEPAVFVTVPAFAGYDHAALARELMRGDAGKVLLFGDNACALRSTSADRARVADYARTHPTVGGEVLTICWTSGTEARPKGVPRDHNHWVLNADVVVEGAGMEPGDTLLNPFPLVNIGSIGGMVLPWLALTGTLVLHHPFNLAIFLAQIAAERVTYTIAPPAVLTALLKAPEMLEQVDFASLRGVGSGSAPLSPWLIEGWARRGIEITNIFGSNEGASLFSGARDVPDWTDRSRYFPRYGAAGQDWAGVVHRVIRTRLVDPGSGEEITERGRAGELRIAGGTTFAQYWRAPELTAQAFDAEGYFRTGDLFEIAGEGEPARFYRFVGRSKEIIVRGGVNISPAELDDLLVGEPHVREAATVGIPDDVLGERIAVAVVANESGAPTLAEITAWLELRAVAIFKHPERLVVMDALPRNAMNKVMRGVLRERVIELLG